MQIARSPLQNHSQCGLAESWRAVGCLIQVERVNSSSLFTAVISDNAAAVKPSIFWLLR
ncbi:hypothetical protein [Microcoleus sp. herbarium12]|uniref:hypothetical protein n=1 Tax=Microcoleus sp. herbarium12 TaxID=3055437 RepID=UPI002FD1662E